MWACHLNVTIYRRLRTKQLSRYISMEYLYPILHIINWQIVKGSVDTTTYHGNTPGIITGGHNSLNRNMPFWQTLKLIQRYH